MDKSNKLENTVDFSLGQGGLLYKFYLWAGLVKKPLFLYKRRVIAVCLFAWLPMFILAMLNGVAFSGVDIPFISDISVHMRFLVSLALLIYAEVIAQERLPVIAQQFLKCDIISSDNRQKFNSIIASAMRLTNSLSAEIFLIIFVITAGHWISKEYSPSGVSTWYMTIVDGNSHLTSTGYWYTFISLPLFQFMLLRWYYRLAIWYRFLWQVSRLPLQLNSLHPDRSGGIGFLENSLYAFEPLLLAHSVLLAGMILNLIWNTGASLSQFKGESISLMVFLIILPLAPTLFFMFSLIKTKRTGTLAYGVVASDYVNDFRHKWIEKPAKNGEALLGTSDIQSLADLTNSFTVSSGMRILPFGKNCIITIVILTALPLFPLMLTSISIDKIISQLIGIVF
jgi:hypothetical protein